MIRSKFDQSIERNSIKAVGATDRVAIDLWHTMAKTCDLHGTAVAGPGPMVSAHAFRLGVRHRQGGGSRLLSSLGFRVGTAPQGIVGPRHRRLGIGGSTITQQLARNLYLSPARTLHRKVPETLI